MGGVPARAEIERDESLARVAGNRAGIVEWANEAFGRLTGIPLAETVNKPVTRFLERAGIELEVVEFVAEHFFAGRTCRIELPFERPDGRCIDVLLEVEAIRGEDGDIDRFIATARERRDEISAATSTSRPALVRTPRPPSGERLDLSCVVRRVAREAVDALLDLAPRPLVDLALAPDLEQIQAPLADVEEIAASLIGAARHAIADSENAWGTLTLSTGRTAPNRRFISQVHAIAAGPADPSRASAIYLEVHDTGSPLPHEALEHVTRGRPARNPREQALVRVRELAQKIGASFHHDSTPGCGNQALVLFFPADEGASAPAEIAALPPSA